MLTRVERLSAVLQLLLHQNLRLQFFFFLAKKLQGIHNLIST